MAWDEWEQLKQAAAERHAAGMQLNQIPADKGSSSANSEVTGGLKSTKQAWNKAAEGVGGLRENIGKALTKLEDGQQGIAEEPGCRTVTAQKDVYDSWARYIKAVSERCGSIKGIFEQVGSDLLKTDEAVKSAVAAVDLKYADTAAIGGRGGR